MGLKVNWKKINEVKKELVSKGFNESTKLNVIILSRKGDYQKVDIEFGNLLDFMWRLSDSSELNIVGLIIMDTEGSVLYRHRRVSGAEEEIPNTGNPYFIRNWKKFSKAQKDTYLNILISQLQSYE